MTRPLRIVPSAPPAKLRATIRVRLPVPHLPDQLLLFALATLLLNLTPGPDMLYAITRGATLGVKAAAAAALGNLAGSLIHTLFVIIGISAILVASSAAFTAIKFAGAAYLIYLGTKALLSRNQPKGPSTRPAATLVRVCRESFLIHTLNPKVAIFFLAFLPQFIAPDAAHPVQSLTILALWFTAQAALVLFLVASLSAAARAHLPFVDRAGIILKRLSGGLLIAFGARLAWATAR